MSPSKRTRVSPYIRIKNGRKEYVSGYVRRSKKITNPSSKMLKQISFGEAARIKIQIEENDPRDFEQTAKLTFDKPNKLWKENTKRVDVLNYDASKPPTVDKLPKKALPGSAYYYRGNVWVMGKDGLYHKKSKEFQKIKSK